jgi:hypothetical protein
MVERNTREKTRRKYLVVLDGEEDEAATRLLEQRLFG